MNIGRNYLRRTLEIYWRLWRRSTSRIRINRKHASNSSGKTYLNRLYWQIGFQKFNVHLNLCKKKMIEYLFAFFSGNGPNEQANNECPYGWQCDSFSINSNTVNLLTSSRSTRLLSLSCFDETTVFATNIVEVENVQAHYNTWIGYWILFVCCCVY